MTLSFNVVCVIMQVKSKPQIGDVDMKVELLFTEIINHSKLYAEELVDQTCRFTGVTQQIPITEYVGKNYCSVSVETIKGKIPAIIDSEYKGALD